MLSIDDLVTDLTNKGHKVKQRTVKYYIERGLLPVTEKVGGYKEGVKLVFPNKDEAIAKIIRIFELKSKGYRLSDIQSLFFDEDRVRKASEQKSSLKRYVDVGGKVYKVFDKIPEGNKFKSFVNVTELLSRQDLDEFGAFKFCSINDAGFDVVEIHKQALFLSPYILRDGGSVYDTRSAFEIISWIILHREYDISWDVLESLSKKHFENLGKYFFWPNADGERSSNSHVSFLKRLRLNAFGSRLKEYFENLYSGIFPDDICYDYRYTDVDSFVNDFLSGSCAFVSSPFQSSEDFLRKF